MGTWFGVSFAWDFFKWFFSGSGDCGTVTGGFSSFPTLGLEALDWTWQFDFSINYVGVGMLCPQVGGRCCTVRGEGGVAGCWGKA